MRRSLAAVAAVLAAVTACSCSRSLGFLGIDSESVPPGTYDEAPAGVDAAAESFYIKDPSTTLTSFLRVDAYTRRAERLCPKGCRHDGAGCVFFGVCPPDFGANAWIDGGRVYLNAISFGEDGLPGFSLVRRDLSTRAETVLIAAADRDAPQRVVFAVRVVGSYLYFADYDGGKASLWRIDADAADASGREFVCGWPCGDRFAVGADGAFWFADGASAYRFDGVQLAQADMLREFPASSYGFFGINDRSLVGASGAVGGYIVFPAQNAVADAAAAVAAALTGADGTAAVGAGNVYVFDCDGQYVYYQLRGKDGALLPAIYRMTPGGAGALLYAPDVDIKLSRMTGGRYAVGASGEALARVDTAPAVPEYETVGGTEVKYKRVKYFALG